MAEQSPAADASGSDEDQMRRLQDAQVPVADRLETILDLAERRNEKVYPVILELLNHPDFEQCKGTLIHALQNYPPEPLFERAVDWLVHGGFEVAHLAFEILDSVSVLSGSQVDAAYGLIASAFETTDQPWRANLLGQALELFSPAE